MFRNSLAFLAAASIAAAPVAVQAAAPAPAVEPAQVERAAAPGGENELVGRGFGSGWLIPGLVLVAAIVAAILILDDDEDVPTSP